MFTILSKSHSGRLNQIRVSYSFSAHEASHGIFSIDLRIRPHPTKPHEVRRQRRSGWYLGSVTDVTRAVLAEMRGAGRWLR